MMTHLDRPPLRIPLPAPVRAIACRCTAPAVWRLTPSVAGMRQPAEHRCDSCARTLLGTVHLLNDTTDGLYSLTFAAVNDAR